MADVTAHLERALAADGPADVLAALLAAWRAYPHPRIAELIDGATRNAVPDGAARNAVFDGATRNAVSDGATRTVSDGAARTVSGAVPDGATRTVSDGATRNAVPDGATRAGTTRGAAAQTPRVDSGTLDERQARWLAIARDGDPVDVPWLLATFVVPRGDLMRERIAALAKAPRDPRIAMGLVELCRTKPMSSRQHRPVWTKLFGLLSRGLDPRLVPVVNELLEMRPVTDFDVYLIGKLRRLHAQLVAAVPAAKPAPVELLDRLAHRLQIDPARAVARTAADFLREVWAAPNDDGPREVFADWLIERGDPRGELITLQIARARGTADPSGAARERKLLAQHARMWMGALEPAVSRTAFRFERGFLFACEVQWRKLAAVPALMTHPAWASVREYRLHADGERACDRWLDHMIALGAKRL